MVSTSLFGSRRFGAWLSLSLVSLGLLALAWPVRLEFQTAPGSFRALRLFWQANPSERLLNSPVLYGDRVFGRALLEADRSLPLDAVLTLSLSSKWQSDAVEAKRRAAAYVLAPRLVVVRRHDDAEPFRLAAASPAGSHP